MGGLGRQAPGGSFVFLISKGNESRQFRWRWIGQPLSSLAVVAGVSPADPRLRTQLTRLPPQNFAADTAATTVKKMIKDRPHRLGLIYVDHPLYFVTFTTRDRRAFPSLDDAQLALQRYACGGIDKFDVALGRYVIMPDHVHLFIRGGRNFTLSSWIGGLKRAMSVVLKSPHIWQPGFFDHILRSDESYAEKWNYVRDNPVRAGLVKAADDWLYQGEIVVIDRA
jgi:putative transposase